MIRGGKMLKLLNEHHKMYFYKIIELQLLCQLETISKV